MTIELVKRLLNASNYIVADSILKEINYLQTKIALVELQNNKLVESLKHYSNMDNWERKNIGSSGAVQIYKGKGEGWEVADEALEQVGVTA